MGLRERVVEWLGAVPVAELEERANRAYEAGFYDGGNDDPASGSIAKGGFGYKRLSDNYLREGNIDFGKALRTAWELWQKSPIAKRVLVMKRDHIIGHGSKPTSDDDAVAELLDDFWTDNKLERRASEFVLQLFGFGEQCLPAFVRESDGRVRLGYIDPASIVRVIKHPDNTLEDWAVCSERMVGGATEKRVYRIIRPDEGYIDEARAIEPRFEGKLVTWDQAALEPWEAEMLADIKGKGAEYDGSCFFFKVNAVSNQSRGMSDLLQVGDWLDQADEVLFALGDREQFAGMFAFDVTLTGANKDAVRERSREIRDNPPRKGSVNVHNDSEAWQMFAPNLGQLGTIETFRAMLGLILGGMGFPVHWFGFGDDANRATAVAQSDPTTKSLEHDQGLVQEALLMLAQFVIDQAEIAGALVVPDEYEVTIDLPEVSVRDISRVGAALGQIGQALTNAEAQGWQSNETSVMIWAKLMQELGIELDPAAEMKAVAAERERAELERAQMQNNGLQQAMNGQPEQDATDELLQALGVNGNR